MIIHDKTNERIEVTNELNMSSLVERYNTRTADLFFDKVCMLSLNDLEELMEDDIIDDELYKKALKLYKEKISDTDNFKDIDFFVLTDTEYEQELYIAYCKADANKILVDKSKDLLSFFEDYRDFELDIELFENINDLLDSCCENETITDFLEDLVFKKMPTQTELAKYLGVTKGAVSQYDNTKRDLMLKGLLLGEIREAFL